jgi:predicted transcriptional regulator of viral defense system
MDWVSIVREEGRRHSILYADELARRYGLSDVVVRNALRRQEKRGLIEHVSNKIYVNKLVLDFSQRELVNILRPDSYISLESALAEWGISTQVPWGLTCVTPGRPKTFESPSVRIIYRRISKKLYWGFKENVTRYGSYRIAEPEKALLDWIYLSLQEGLPVALDELEFQRLDAGKILGYSEQFPKTVRDYMLPSLVQSHTAE